MRKHWATSVPVIHIAEKKFCHFVQTTSTKINLWHQSSWIKPFILGLHKHFISRKEQLHSWAPSGAFVQRKFWQRPNQTRRQRHTAAMLTVKLTVPLSHKTGQPFQHLFQKKMMARAFLPLTQAQADLWPSLEGSQLKGSMFEAGKERSKALTDGEDRIK